LYAAAAAAGTSPALPSSGSRIGIRSTTSYRLALPQQINNDKLHSTLLRRCSQGMEMEMGMGIEMGMVQRATSSKHWLVHNQIPVKQTESQPKTCALTQGSQASQPAGSGSHQMPSPHRVVFPNQDHD